MDNLEKEIELLNKVEYACKIENLDAYNPNYIFLAILKIQRYDLLKSNSINLNITKNSSTRDLIEYLLSDEDILYYLEKNGFTFQQTDKIKMSKIIMDEYIYDNNIFNNFVKSFFENDEELNKFIRDNKEKFTIYLKENDENSIAYVLTEKEEFINLILSSKKTKLIRNPENYSVQNLKLLSSLLNDDYDYPYCGANKAFCLNLFSKKDELNENEFCNLLGILKDKSNYARKKHNQDVDDFTILVKDNIDYLINCVSKNKFVPKCLVESSVFRDECIKRNMMDLVVQCVLPSDIMNNETLTEKYCRVLNLSKQDFYNKYKWLMNYYKKNNNIFNTVLANTLKQSIATFNDDHFERLINDIDIQMSLGMLDDKIIMLISKMINRFNYKDYDISFMVSNIIYNINNYEKLLKSISIDEISESELNNLIMVLQLKKNPYQLSDRNELKNYEILKYKKYSIDRNVNDLNLNKDNLLKYLFNISFDEAKNINKQYCYDREKCVLELLGDSELPKNIYEILCIINNIVETNDANVLDDYFNKFESQDIYNMLIPLETYLRSQYAKLYSESLYKININEGNDKTEINSIAEYNGKSVKVCIPHNSFNFLIHCVGTCANVGEEIDNNYQKDWEDRPQIQDHLIACSYIDENSIYSLRSNNSIIFGFSSIEGGSLHGMSDVDIDSIGIYATLYNTSSILMQQGNRTHFFVPSLILNSSKSYNEIVIERRNNNETIENTFKRKPDYIIMPVSSLNKNNFMLLENLFSEKLSFISNEDKELIINSSNNSDIKKVIEKYSPMILNNDALDINGIINNYVTKIAKAKYYENCLRASSEFDIPLVVVDKFYYFKKMLSESNAYDDDMKINILNLYISSNEKRRKEMFNLIKNKVKYDTLFPKQEMISDEHKFPTHW